MEVGLDDLFFYKGADRMSYTFQLIEKPNVIALEQVLKNSRLNECVSVLDDHTIQLELGEVLFDFFTQLISEYCLFLMMDQYLRQQHQFIEISTAYYEEVLEEVIQSSTLRQSILTEFLSLIEETADDEIRVLKLTPFRQFQLKDLYYDLDDWFVRHINGERFSSSTDTPEVIKIPFNNQEEFQEVLHQYYEEIDFEAELRAFKSLYLEVGQETVYLENLNGDVFSIDSLLNYIGINIRLTDDLIEQSENPLRTELLTLMKALIGVLNVKRLHVYQKDRAFMEELLKEVEELKLTLEIKWRD